MAKQYTIKLDEYDLGQILDGLQVRADSWRRTAEYLKTGEMSDDSFLSSKSAVIMKKQGNSLRVTKISLEIYAAKCGNNRNIFIPRSTGAS